MRVDPEFMSAVRIIAGLALHFIGIIGALLLFSTLFLSSCSLLLGDDCPVNVFQMISSNIPAYLIATVGVAGLVVFKLRYKKFKWLKI